MAKKKKNEINYKVLSLYIKAGQLIRDELMEIVKNTSLEHLKGQKQEIFENFYYLRDYFKKLIELLNNIKEIDIVLNVLCSIANNEIGENGEVFKKTIDRKKISNIHEVIVFLKEHLESKEVFELFIKILSFENLLDHYDEEKIKFTVNSVISGLYMHFIYDEKKRKGRKERLVKALTDPQGLEYRIFNLVTVYDKCPIYSSELSSMVKELLNMAKSGIYK